MKNTHFLKTALMYQFQEPQARHLAMLFELSLAVETLCYEQIALPKDQKHDCILIAFEERMLIPDKSGRSSAWEDRILSLCPGEIYFIPPVVRCYIERARETGKFDSESAVKQTLLQHVKSHVDDLVRFFVTVRHHAAAYTAEVGLMGAIMREIGLTLDLHDVIDLFVILGIISPCTRSPMATGLSWYEINPCLYWDLKQMDPGV